MKASRAEIIQRIAWLKQERKETKANLDAIRYSFLQQSSLLIDDLDSKLCLKIIAYIMDIENELQDLLYELRRDECYGE